MGFGFFQIPLAVLIAVLGLFRPAPVMALDAEAGIVPLIEGALDSPPEWERISVTKVRLEPGRALPEGAEIELLRELSGRPLGRKKFQLVARAGQEETHFWATAMVKAYRPVYYLARQLSRGDLVSASDLVSQDMDVTRIPKGALTDPSEIDGLMAVRSMGMNVLLRRSFFREAPVATRGERVFLIADNGLLRMATPGVLREDAYKGQAVRVTNLMSNKEVMGWIVDSGTVRVEF